MRVFNFAAGPATLPLPVLEQASREMTDWQGSGMSVMEISHRSAAFVAVAEQAERDLRELMGIPQNYKVLFLQGGATGQFTAIPLNLTAPGDRVDYLNTGVWSKKALTEAKRYCTVKVVADEAATHYTTVPAPGTWQASADAAYLHYTPNETIGGVEFDYVPESGAVPLVADMSSTILSRPIDVSRFGLIYAGAQKNIGPSGLVLVIIREDLLGRARADTPPIWDYTVMAQEGSMLNTPPTFGIYIAGLVFQWLKREGGLAAIGERNQRKARLLYEYIDASGCYQSPVSRNARSWMNVPFNIPDPALEALAAGLANLEGHRSVGGMRASIYNAMPLQGVEALVAFMRDFQQRHG